MVSLIKKKNDTMRKLIMKMSMTIDGFVCGPKGENDWIFRSSDEESRAWLLGQSGDASLIIMGRNSFEVMASYWPTAPGPLAAVMNEIPKAVFTQKGFKGAAPIKTTTEEQSRAAASWSDAQILDGDLAENIQKLKSGSGKPITAIAGAGFMRSLIATGLIDEYHLVTHPVVLGQGMPIFNGVTKPMDLKLVDVKSFPGGIVVRTYHA
jgi:dihydrofolate reductase